MDKNKKILIVGAGIAGKILKNDIEKNHKNIKIAGFIDDAKGTNEMRVLGEVDDLVDIEKKYGIDEVVIAIPSANGELVRRILLNNLQNRMPIKIVPRDQRIIRQCDVRYSKVKDLDFEDFLGRPFIRKDIQKLFAFYRNKKILVTGGAGSIGSEIVKQLLDLGAKKVIIYDNSEYLIFDLSQRLKESGIESNKFRLIVGNILNYDKLEFIVKCEKPNLIFHAAAYKHVHLMQENIDEAVINNVIGTKNVVDIAIKNKVNRFTFISTDKAVNPTSIMGATKKLCEFYIKSLSEVKTKFNIVRFGNVINSNGSVLPLFERQIREGKFITITDKKMERFFMSIREASQLVINSTAFGRSGDIFILNMGELINIYKTGLCVIRSKNFIPEKDVKIKITGLRKGEKMIEELFTESEKNNLIKTGMKDIFRLKNFECCSKEINVIISDLENMTKKYTLGSKNALKKYFKEIFPSIKAE
ncbi:MAG: polysaccharide biosynthesis protein [Patescibacteria group bacterium]